MSSLRGRTRDSSWQWLVIGLVLGLGCSGVVCLGGYAANLIAFNLPGNPTEVPPTVAITVIITATPAPVTPTVAAPTNATVVAQAPGTQAAQPTVPVIPTISGLSTVAVVPILQQTNTPATAIATIGSVAGATNIAVLSPPTAVPSDPSLAATDAITAPTSDPNTTFSSQASDLIGVTGGSFKMGTDPNEIQRAIQDCQDRDKGQDCNANKYLNDALPVHNVIVDSFQVERYEVTYTQYVAFLNTLGPGKHLNGCGGQLCVLTNGPKSATKNTDPGAYVAFDGKAYTVSSKFQSDHPVAFVTWYGADAYCRALGRRLPTEAEWEYAARGGSEERLYPFGNVWDETKAKTSRPVNPKNIGSVAVTDPAYKGDITPGTAISGMAGNVSEWVSDWYDAGYYKSAEASKANPRGAASGTEKVYRGGNWDAIPMFARSMQRGDAQPNETRGTIGFRCAADGGASAPPPSSSNTTGTDPNAAVPPASAATLASGTKK